MNEQKKICLMGNGVNGKQGLTEVDLSKPEEFFTERELAGVLNAMSKTGPARWVKASRAYGTDGYIFQQARIMVFNTYAMPSQCIMIFNEDQMAMFWAYVNKLELMQDCPDFRAAVSAFIVSKRG